ncbi:MAG: HAD-IA family hydrolase, partial [Ktedonobacteraceae bacterium]|nr:HAD-IA family hydrolase [Ktedonobacteraceae bacterium]
MPRLTIFLDDGGVMNDNNQRAIQWRRLVGEFFTPLLGSTPEKWARANAIVAERLFESSAWQARLQAASCYSDFDRTYQIDWLTGMCEIAGVPSPPDEECFQLAREASAYITRRVRAAFPGAVETIRLLHNQGYMLHTASGGSSPDLARFLEGMGVRHCFDRLYGPDLIDTFKDGPAYYERIFADTGVNAAAALVVDDSPRMLNWAAQLGAQTVLVSNSPHHGMEATIALAA